MTSSLQRLPTLPTLTWDDCRLLVESVTDYAIFMLDTSGYVATWNAGAQKIKGYVAEEIVGRHFSTFYLPEDVAADKPRSLLETAVRNGRVEDEGWRVRKDGTRFWANVTITALRDPAGQLRGFGKVTRDLTERRTVEDHLRESEQRFHALVDAVVDYAIFRLDGNGHVATWNPGAQRLKGYEADEIIGEHFSVFYTPEDREQARPSAILDAARREGRFEDEGWRIRKDGTRFWASVAISVLKNELGAVIGFAKVTRDLTERREADELLRRSEERFRLLIENIGDYAIYMLEPEGSIATWNTGAERLKGYSAREVLGKHFEIFFPPEDVALGKPERELREARVHGRYEDEGWRLRKDGTRFWANAILTAVQDRDGTLLGYAKITRDLTSRREAEENERRLLRERTAREVAEDAERRVRDSEERHRALSARLEIILEGVADGITVEDRDGALVFANGAAARLCGFGSVEECLRATPRSLLEHFEVFDEQGRRIHEDSLPARLVQSGTPFASAVVLLRERTTGRHWSSSIRSSPVLARDGAPEFVVSIWHDVTIEQRAERDARYLADASVALGASMDPEQFLAAFARVLVPALADGCSISLLEGERLRNVVSTHVDPAKRGFSEEYQAQLSAEPTVPDVWSVARAGKPELFNETDRAPLDAAAPAGDRLALLSSIGAKAMAVAPLSLGNEVLGMIWLVSTESNRRYDESQLQLLMQLAERAAAAVDRARLYRAAKESALAAEQASRAKDDFLATVSHELRTPLSAILGWSTLLKDRVADPELVKPIHSIHRNAQAQVRIIEDILDVSRIIAGKFRIDPKPADLLEITREAMDVVRPAAVAKWVSLTLDSDREFCLLIGDPERLRQVIWNLLSNAVKFTSSGGRVVVRVRQLSNEVVLEVTDNGAGVDPSFLPYVFDRFRQADPTSTRNVGGLGLGLAIVKHIVEQHGGTVEAFSAGRGTGATFSVRLPSSAAQPDSAPNPAEFAPPTPPARPLARVRVLIIDDETDARDVIVAILEQAGAVVSSAASVAEALEAFQRSGPDVILSDLAMPGEDGFTFLERVRKLQGGSNVPVIALTAYAREEDRARVLAAGFQAHLAKPIEREALTAAVANVVGRETASGFG